MPYSDKILEHYNNPRNVGSFSQGDANVGTGLVGVEVEPVTPRVAVTVTQHGLCLSNGYN